VNEALESSSTSSFYLESVYWTERILEGLRHVRSQLQRLIPGFRGVGVGYLDAESPEEADAFGVIIHAQGNRDLARGFFIGQGSPGPVPLDFIVEVARRSSGRETPIEVQWLIEEVREYRWSPYEWCPVVVRQAHEQIAAPLEHPLGGTSACWVRSRASQANRVEGFLTAKHVISAALGREALLGDVVPMAVSGSSVVGDLAPSQIDAAVMERAFPAIMTRLPVQPYIAQYMPVEIRTVGNPVQSRVIAVTDTYNVWDDPDIPAYLELDQPASPGDSGSIVIDTTTNAAAGIYRGEFNAPHPRRRQGRAAHIRQLEALMDLELYR
jgi:hypothetical protein